jgi:hypothetical protein
MKSLSSSLPVDVKKTPNPRLLPKPSWRSTFSKALEVDEENDLESENNSSSKAKERANTATDIESLKINSNDDIPTTTFLSTEDLISLSRVRTMPLSALLAEMPQSIHNKIISTSLLSAQTKLLRQRKIEEYVFGCIHANFLLRRIALTIAGSSLFEILVTIMVFSNAVILGLADPILDETYWGNRAIKNSEVIFNYFYAIEASIKIFAFGLGFDRMIEDYFGKALCERIHVLGLSTTITTTTTTTSERNSSLKAAALLKSNRRSYIPTWLKSTTDSGYLINAWNQLDLIIAILGILQLHASSLSLPFIANITAVRTLRLLRPLRLIMSLDGARIILDAIKTSLRGFIDVFLLVLLSCFAFALVAVELWRGNMNGHCGYSDTISGNSSFIFLGRDLFLHTPIGCGLPCEDIPYGQKCLYGQAGGGDLCPAEVVPFTSSTGDIFYNWTETTCRNTNLFSSTEVNYDNVLYGMLNAFTFITTEGWSQAMYAVWHHFGYPELVSTIFVIHVFFGSAFILELALAVLWERYTVVSLADEDRENAFHMLIVRRLGIDEEALEITRKAAKRAVEFLQGPLCDSDECKEAVKLATFASLKAPLRDHIQQEAKDFIFGDPNDALFQEEQEKELLGGRRLSEVIDLKYIRQELVVYATDVARAAKLDQDVATTINSLRNQPFLPENKESTSRDTKDSKFLEKIKGFGYAKDSKSLFYSMWSTIKGATTTNETKENSTIVSPKLHRSPNFKDANPADSKKSPLVAEMRAFAEKKKLKGFVNDKVRRQLMLQKKALNVFDVRNAGLLKGSKSFGPSAVEVQPQIDSVEEKINRQVTLSGRSLSPSDGSGIRNQKSTLKTTSNTRLAGKLLRVGTKVFSDAEVAAVPIGSRGSSKRSTSSDASDDEKETESSSPSGENIKRSLSILHQTEASEEITMKDVAKMRNVFIPWRTSAIYTVPPFCQRFAYGCCGCGCAPDTSNDHSEMTMSKKQSEYQFEETFFEVDLESESHKSKVRTEVLNRCCCLGRQTHIYIRHPPSIDEFIRHITFGLYDIYSAITPSFPSWISRPSHFIVDHWLFKLFAMLCVFANIVVLGLVYHGMNPQFEAGLELCNFVFVCIFAVELFLKLLGFGPQVLFSDIYNVFDALIVIISIIDATVTNTSVANVTPLRVLRIARVFKLLRTWRNLRVLMGALAIGIGKAMNAFMLLFFMIYVFAVVGMQMFGPYYEEHSKNTGEPIPFSNFQSLFWSLITIFQVMDNENWDSVVNYHKSTFGFASVLFFLLVFVIGNFIFLNLFITILMTVLQTPPDDLIDSIENGLEHDLELEDEEEENEDVEGTPKEESIHRVDKLDMHEFDPEKDLPLENTPRSPEHSLKLGVAEIINSNEKKQQGDPRKKPNKLFRSESKRILPVVSKFKRFLRLKSVRAAMQTCPFCISHNTASLNVAVNQSPSTSPSGSRTPNQNGERITVKSALKDTTSSRSQALPSAKDFEKSIIDKQGRLVPNAAASNFLVDSKSSLRTSSTLSLPSHDIPSDPSQSALEPGKVNTRDSIGGGVGSLLESPESPPIPDVVSLSSSMSSVDKHSMEMGVSTLFDHNKQHPSHNFHKEGSRLLLSEKFKNTNNEPETYDVTNAKKDLPSSSSSSPVSAVPMITNVTSNVSKFAGTKSKFIDQESSLITKPVINVVTSDSGVAKSVEIFIPASKINTDDTDDIFFNPLKPISSKAKLIETDPIRIIVSNDGTWRIVLASETEKLAKLDMARKDRKRKRLQNLRTSCCFPKPGSTFSAFFPCFNAALTAREDAVSQINRFESFRAWWRGQSSKISPAPPASQLETSRDSSHGVSSEEYYQNPFRKNVDTLDWIVDKVADFIAFPVSSELDDNTIFPEFVNFGVFQLSRTSSMRRPFLYLYKWFWFDLLTVLITIIACVNLALDNPSLSLCAASSCSLLVSYLEYSEIICVFVFILEVFIISMARGLIDKPYSTLRNGWYQLDIITIITSIISLATGNTRSVSVNVIGTFRIVRASRVVRVLRTISFMPSLRIVIDAIILAFSRAKETVGVLLVIMYVFAVLGLQSFLGGSMTCSDAGPGMFSTGGAAHCKGTFIARGDLCKMANSTDMEALCRNSPQGLELPRIWYSHPWNFDNIGSAMLIVFELLTGENWPTLMHISVDYAGKDMSPVKNYSMWAALYYVAIQMVLNQLLIELFSGVIIDTYLELRANSDNMSLLTDDQKLWVTNMRVMLSSRPVRMVAPPAGSGSFLRFRIWLFNIVITPFFDFLVLMLIVLQVLLHSTQYFDWGVPHADTLNRASGILTWIFVAEISVKVLALGNQFSQDWWNQFDTVIVFGSAITSLIINDTTSWISKLFRVIRTLRVLRLLKLSAGLLRLLRALYLALPSLSNVSFILLLIVYIYSVIGINAFSGVRTGWFGYINNDANFNTFGSAYITLIRSMTGENYNGLMHDLMVEPPFCIPNLNCGSVWFSVIFFVSFYTITAFMVLNILTAVVMEAYDGCSEESEQSSYFASVSGEKQSTYRLTPVAMEQYLVEWNKRDLEGTQFLSKNDLVALLIDLNFPLGLKGDKRLLSTVRSGPGGEDKLEIRQRMQARNIIKKLPLVPRDSDQKYHFHAVLHALMDRASGGSPLGAPIDAVRIDGSHKASGLSLLMTDKLVTMQRHLRKKVKQSMTQHTIEKQNSEKIDVESSSTSSSNIPQDNSMISNPLDSKYESMTTKNSMKELVTAPTNLVNVKGQEVENKEKNVNTTEILVKKTRDEKVLETATNASILMPKFKVLKSAPSMIFVEEEADDISVAVSTEAKTSTVLNEGLPPLKRLESTDEISRD